MTPSRKRLLVEVAVAAALGLLTGVFHALESVPLAMPHIVPRILYVLSWVAGPGFLVGSVFISLVVGFFTTNTLWLDRVATLVGLVANVGAFGLLWFMLRTRSRESRRWKLAVALLVVWLVFSIPVAVFGSMWMTL